MLKIYNTYIHIPFCERKCNYCDFVSFSLKSSNYKKNIARYISYLKKEIEIYKKSLILTENQETIYFGGGTPSVLTTEEINEILKNFKYDSRTEITLEVNPKTVDEKKLKEYKEIGINRLSIGIQSFDNKILKTLGRIHSSEEAVETYNLARRLGFNNISLDLMFALPEQNKEDLEDDLEKLFKLNPEHFSIYSLIWEEGTNFFKRLEKGELKKSDNDIEAEMYESIIELAKKNNYMHYEISNFSKKKFESKHNMNYWKNNNYLGLGLSASGYLGNLRYKNYSSLDEYYKGLDLENLPVDKEEKEYLTQEEIEVYKYLLGFRMLEKPLEPEGKYIEICEELLREGYLKKIGKSFVVSKKGLMLFNDFIPYFL